MARRKQPPTHWFFSHVIRVSSAEGMPYTFDNIPALHDGHRAKFTRNKIKYAHDLKLVVTTERAYLKTGDYAVKGYENVVAVERKELGDAFTSFTTNHERFERELGRLAEFQRSFVVIEDTLDVLMNPRKKYGDAWRSEARPESVFGSIVAWQMRYPTQWLFAGSRRTAEIYTFAIFERAAREGMFG